MRWNLCRDTLYSLRFFVGLVFFSWFSARINRLNYATMAPYSRLHIYLFLSKWYRCHVSPDMYQKHPSKNGRIINRPFVPVIPLQNHRTAKAGRISRGHLVQRHCSSWITQSWLYRTVSKQLLNVLKGGKSTTVLGSQCSVILTMK